MSMKKGVCRLCGELKELSEEHIPPRKAFNDHQIIYESMKDVLGQTGRRYSKSSNGIKQYTLCEKCNNLTGGWYATDFVEWSRQGYEFLDKLSLHDVLYLPFYIKPLNVLKQILTMVVATIEEHRVPHYEYLRRFLLNKEQKYMPDDMNVFVYFTKTSKPRFANMEAVISRVDIGAVEYVNAEIALPPFGYCITSTRKSRNKSIATAQGLYNLTRFSQHDYNVWSIEHLKLPFKEVNSPFPLDYRSQSEVDSQIK